MSVVLFYKNANNKLAKKVSCSEIDRKFIPKIIKEFQIKSKNKIHTVVVMEKKSMNCQTMKSMRSNVKNGLKLKKISSILKFKEIDEIMVGEQDDAFEIGESDILIDGMDNYLQKYKGILIQTDENKIQNIDGVTTTEIQEIPKKHFKFNMKINMDKLEVKYSDIVESNSINFFDRSSNELNKDLMNQDENRDRLFSLEDSEFHLGTLDFMEIELEDVEYIGSNHDSSPIKLSYIFGQLRRSVSSDNSFTEPSTTKLSTEEFTCKSLVPMTSYQIDYSMMRKEADDNGKDKVSSKSSQIDYSMMHKEDEDNGKDKVSSESYQIDYEIVQKDTDDNNVKSISELSKNTDEVDDYTNEWTEVNISIE